jgi:hypothetical protein
MLRGTNITLGTETVSNVLIGEPSEGGRAYTLGIPKGDNHNWLDTLVSFRDKTWRTVGYPDEGIEENIPLCWGKNVHVRLCESTGGITVFEKVTYIRHFFAYAEWHDLRGVRTDKQGSQTADGVNVLIYSCSVGEYIPKAGDLIVSGECSFTFDTATEQALSESMAAFRQAYPGFATISAVSTEKNGALPDISITAR